MKVIKIVPYYFWQNSLLPLWTSRTYPGIYHFLKGVLFASLVFLNLLVAGQNSEIEDMKQKLENHSQQDSVRVNLLLGLSTKIGANDPSKVIQYGQEAMHISQAINSPSNLGESYLLIGLGFQHSAEHDSAFFYYERASQTYLKLNDENNYGEALNKMGMLYAIQTDFGKAIAYLNEALEIGEKPGNHILLMKANKSMGEVHRAQGLNEEALVFFGKAAELAQNLADTFSMASIKRDVGSVYYQLGNDTEAYKNYKEALSFHRSGAIDEPRSRMYLLLSMGNVATYLERFEEALSVFREAEDIAQQTNQPRALINIYVSFSHCYKTMGDNSGKKTYYNQSLDYSKRGLLLTREVNLAQEKHQVLIGMTNIYESLGDFENAYITSKLRVALSDSIFNETKSAQFAEIKTKYETERKEKDNLLLTQENLKKASQIEKQQLWVYSLSGGGILLAILFVISYRFYLERKKMSVQLTHDKTLITEQTKKLVALDSFKSRFFANVSHDLRTPLTLIQGHISQIIEDENYLSSRSEGSLQKLAINADKLVHLTDEIRDLILLEDARLELEFAVVDINNHLARLVNLFGSAAEARNISLSFNTKIDGTCVAHVDPMQFEKIIYNLLANALKFTASGGKISVTLQKQEDSIKIDVEDDGVGISEDKVAYIFSRYYQASDDVHYAKEGIGIGLALVLELVKLHGGVIEVESELNEGSKFSIQLPLNLDKEVTNQAKIDSYVLQKKDLLLEPEVGDDHFVDVRENEKRSQNADVVLIVDDHPDIRNYIKELIDSTYIIRQAANGQEALTILEREKINIVITDLMMPWMDGHDLIAEMKDRDSLAKIPVLVVSARTTEEDKIKVLEKGVNNFLAKPFQPDQLKLRISNMLNKVHDGPDIWENLASDKKQFSSIEKNLLSKMNMLILSRIDDPSLSVNHIAEELITSSRNAFTMVNELAGMSPKDYINHVRFQYVGDLMKKRKVKSLREAARAIGMTNGTHFSRQFQKSTGQNPTDLMT